MPRKSVTSRKILLINETFELLNSYTWEWFCTFTLPDEKYRGCNSDIINSMMMRFFRQICVTLHIQIGGYFLICYKDEHPHVHALLLSNHKRSKRGLSLMDFSKGRWQKNWPHLAKIQVPNSNKAVCAYVASQYKQNKSDRVVLNSYNSKLLKREHKCGGRTKNVTGDGRKT